MDLLSPWHLLLIFIVALLVFGPRRLPELGGALGRTIREFQRSMKDVSGTDEQQSGADRASTAPPPGTSATTAASPPGTSDGGAAQASSPSDGGPRPS